MALLAEILFVAKGGLPRKINAKSECYVEKQLKISFGRGDRVVYGGGLENRFRLFGERGFESHPLRQLGKGRLDSHFAGYSNR